MTEILNIGDLWIIVDIVFSLAMLIVLGSIRELLLDKNRKLGKVERDKQNLDEIKETIPKGYVVVPKDTKFKMFVDERQDNAA